MAKLTLNNLGNLSNEQTAVTAINANSNAIETAMENTLSRDGTTPNEMQANLDMNNNRILNLPAAITTGEPLTLGQISNLIPDIFVQPEAPSTTVIEGSLWIDSDSANNDLYSLTGGVWVDTGVNIKGDQGPQGASGSGSGDVTGPGSSVDGNIVIFDGTTGTIIEDSGVSAAGLVTEAELAASNGSTLVGFVQAGTGADTRTVQAKLRETCVSVLDFGADPTGVADCTASFQEALAAALTQNRSLYIPGGTYLLNGGSTGPDGYKNGLLVPFDGIINFDPSSGVLIYGDGPRTRLKCGSNDMVLVRAARNCVTIRDLVLDFNSHSNVILLGVIPEDMTQNVTAVSQSFFTAENVDRIGGPGVEGIVMQPGPQIGGGGSGCFYHNIIGGLSNFVSGGRHIWLKKSVDWAEDENYITRTNFIGQRLVRGNCGYYFEDGSEINLIGCNEELIANGTTPLATPTARYIGGDCAQIIFNGGYSESCTASVDAFANNITSYGYTPASGGVTPWRTYVSAYDDPVYNNLTWTPTLSATGGGTQGASTSTGRAVKIGKLVFISAQVSAAKGTLTGSLLLNSPFISDPAWTGAAFQDISITSWSGMTFSPTDNETLYARISGATIEIRKNHNTSGATSGLTVAECGDPIIFQVKGWFKVA